MDDIQKAIAALNFQWQQTRQGMTDELYSSLSTAGAATGGSNSQQQQQQQQQQVQQQVQMGVNGPAGVPLSAGLTASALDSSISASSNSFIGSVNSNNTRLEQPQLQEQHLPSPLPSTVAALASLSATSSSALSSSGGTDIFNPSQQMHSGHTHQTLHQSSFPRNYTSSTNMSSLPPVSASVASTSENISQHALRSSSMSPTVAATATATATSSSSFFSHAPPLSTTSSAMGIGIGGYVPPSLPASSSVIDPSLPSSSYDPASTINSTTTSTTNYYNNNISAGGAPPPPPPPPAPVTASTIPLSAIPPSQIPSYMASSAHLLENINMAIAASNPLGSVMAAGGGASSGIAASTIMSAADSMPSINDPSTAGEQMAKRFEAIRANKAAAPAKRKRTTIDIALLMDLTGSMQHWFDQAKRKVREIVYSVNSKYPDAELKMGFVGYRDFTDDGESRYEVHDFGTAEELESFMEREVGRCDGGFDAAEDVIGGFAEILKLSWSAKTRLIIFVADAPGHGYEFHGMGPEHDRYLTCDDPSGKKSSDLKTYVRQMCNKNIDLYFFHLMHVTIQMEQLLDSHLQKFGCRLYDLKLDQNVEQFLPNVLQSIDSSVMRSNWGN